MPPKIKSKEVQALVKYLHEMFPEAESAISTLDNFTDCSLSFTSGPLSGKEVHFQILEDSITLNTVGLTVEGNGIEHRNLAGTIKKLLKACVEVAERGKRKELFVNSNQLGAQFLGQNGVKPLEGQVKQINDRLLVRVDALLKTGTYQKPGEDEPIPITSEERESLRDIRNLIIVEMDQDKREKHASREKKKFKNHSGYAAQIYSLSKSYEPLYTTSDSPNLLSDIARSSVGPIVLMNFSFMGVFDLKDEEVRQSLESYLNQGTQEENLQQESLKPLSSKMGRE
jgi:hypothetical protein